MGIVIGLLLMVEVVTAFLLVLVILAQKSRDQGLGMAFGGGMGESLFGSRAGNVLTRLTVILAIIFMVSTVALGMLYAKKGGGGAGSVMDSVPVAAPAPAAQEEAPLALPPAAPFDGGEAQPVALQVQEDGSLAPVELPAEGDAVTVDEVAPAAEAAVEEAAAGAEEAVEAAAEEVAAEAAPEAVEEPAPAAE